MTSNVRGFPWLGVLLLILGTAGCSSAPPADQFKTISDGKKAQLTKFLESKQSRLSSYEATVTEEPNVDKRGDHTHIGRIEFQYALTKPEGEFKAYTVSTAQTEYHFSTTEKKWVFIGCVLKGLEPKEGLLVTFPEVKAAFEK